MHTFVLILHIIAGLSIIVLVLLQHGKGADMGAAFGSGSAGSLFGSAGASNFLSKTTAVLAASFFATSLALTWFSGAPASSGGVTEGLVAPAGKSTETKPAAPAPSAPAPAGSSGKPTEIPK